MWSKILLRHDVSRSKDNLAFVATHAILLHTILIFIITGSVKTSAVVAACDVVVCLMMSLSIIRTCNVNIKEFKGAETAL